MQLINSGLGRVALLEIDKTESTAFVIRVGRETRDLSKGTENCTEHLICPALWEVFDVEVGVDLGASICPFMTLLEGSDIDVLSSDLERHIDTAGGHMRCYNEG